MTSCSSITRTVRALKVSKDGERRSCIGAMSVIGGPGNWSRKGCAEMVEQRILEENVRMELQQ